MKMEEPAVLREFIDPYLQRALFPFFLNEKQGCKYKGPRALVKNFSAPSRRPETGLPTFPLRTFSLTLPNRSTKFCVSLGDRLAAGRMTLDHATEVRILVPQPTFAGLLARSHRLAV